MENTAGVIRKFDFKALGLGYASFMTLNYAFDYALYPWVIYQKGPIFGGIIMALLSVAACLLTALVYDFLKKDLLGIEALKDIKEDIQRYGQSRKKKVHKIMAWFLGKGRWAEFLFLSMKFDPFITTVYMRNGVRKFNGFKKKEWQIFWGSALVSNAYWTTLSFSGVEVFLRIFNG